jgi:acyl dehydratase
MKVKVGDKIPQWEMESVSAQRMATMAAILRDPNPVHWDRDTVDKMFGIGKRTINQGLVGIGYMFNMLHAWSGENSVKGIKMGFPIPMVLDGDHVIAKGEVTAVTPEENGQMAECNIWLEKEGERLLDGTASVFLTK